MTDRGGERSRASGAEALFAEQARVRRSRAGAGRVLAARRARRRLMPPLAAGSVVLLGTGAFTAWIHAIADASAASSNAAVSSSAPPSAPSTSSVDQATLDQLRHQISADESALAAIHGQLAALDAHPAQPGKPSPANVARTTAAAPPKAAAPAKQAVAPAPPPKPAATKAAPAPPPAPAPKTHATTGASGARP